MSHAVVSLKQTDLKEQQQKKQLFQISGDKDRNMKIDFEMSIQ